MLEDVIVEFILKSETLKRIHRSGWQIAGVHVADYESVAAHSWGSSLIALLISKHIARLGGEINTDCVLMMSLLHDISEAELSDIPKRATDLGGAEMKAGKMKAESEAFRELLEPLRSLLSIKHDQMGEGTSLEEKVVRAADLLDMLFHVIALERAGADPNLLDEFFVNSEQLISELGIELANSLFVRLEEMHNQNIKRQSE
ncbi:HD domain-containing protein [Candidatus Thorarchaeota archaeon]|nr:MAG: HD domain-containing protein [Candidatus Thorarchaeota archaeon]